MAVAFCLPLLCRAAFAHPMFFISLARYCHHFSFLFSHPPSLSLLPHFSSHPSIHSSCLWGLLSGSIKYSSWPSSILPRRSEANGHSSHLWCVKRKIKVQ